LERLDVSSLKADAIDNKILAVLMEDGRASFRKIARRTSLTTPTVSSRVTRMIKAGLIQKFVPVLAQDSVQRGVVAFAVLRAESDPEKVAGRLAEMSEVEGVYLTTGENEITLKVAVETVQGLHSFLRENAKERDGVSLVSTQIITRIVKNSLPPLLPGQLTIDLRCDYCRGEVASTRPYNLVAGSSRYYFCCKTCRAAYLGKYGARLARIRGTRQE
jgi:Lrp/AsnC family transcriptional regulator, leucine-responsive regulatory protein